MCLDEAWTKLSSLRDMFNIAAHSREKDYLGFEQEVWEKLSNACELFEAAEQNRRFEYLNFEKIVKEYQETN